MRIALITVVGLLAGCITIGTGDKAPAHSYLQLQDVGQGPARPQPLIDALLIRPEPGDALADTVSIAYSPAPNRFSLYQFASWTERPVRRLPLLLARRLEQRGVVGAVGQLGDPLRADWLLTLRVDTLYHDVGATPNRARVGLTAGLYDRRQRVQRGRQSFVADVPMTGSDSSSAAAAMSQATAQAFDQLVPWLEGVLAAHAGAGAGSGDSAAMPAAVAASSASR
ncbi:MAG: ABC-type transport auxiliary lipoprotein family protein [Rubrivivax sp.]